MEHRTSNVKNFNFDPKGMGSHGMMILNMGVA